MKQKELCYLEPKQRSLSEKIRQYVYTSWGYRSTQAGDTGMRGLRRRALG